jgi:lipid A 4'-phosphatase
VSRQGVEGELPIRGNSPVAPPMNRTGLCIALTIAVVVGVLFGVYAQLDVNLSGWFFDANSHKFIINGQPWEQHARDAARWLIALISVPAFVAICGKVILPRRRMLMGGRAALFVVVTLALGPGLVANTLFKDHSGRSRPFDTVEFGGTDRFTAWWDPRGPCPNNCSFIAGEPSGAFWTLAPASLAPPQLRLLAYGAALAFGATVGVVRIAGGGHFFTDVVFAGVFMYFVIWPLHRLIFRGQTSRMDEDGVERALGRIGEAISRALTALARRIDRRRDERL